MFSHKYSSVNNMANGIIITNKITNKTKSNMVIWYLFTKKMKLFMKYSHHQVTRYEYFMESFVLFVNSFIIIVLVLFAIKAV